jgi:hypothetical protein
MALIRISFGCVSFFVLLLEPVYLILPSTSCKQDEWSSIESHLLSPMGQLNQSPIKSEFSRNMHHWIETCGQGGLWTKEKMKLKLTTLFFIVILSLYVPSLAIVLVDICSSTEFSRDPWTILR